MTVCTLPNTAAHSCILLADQSQDEKDIVLAFFKEGAWETRSELLVAELVKVVYPGLPDAARKARSKDDEKLLRKLGGPMPAHKAQKCAVPDCDASVWVGLPQCFKRDDQGNFLCIDVDPYCPGPWRCYKHRLKLCGYEPHTRPEVIDLDDDNNNGREFSLDFQKQIKALVKAAKTSGLPSRIVRLGKKLASVEPAIDASQVNLEQAKISLDQDSDDNVSAHHHPNRKPNPHPPPNLKPNPHADS